MFIGHLPAGYLLGRATRRRFGIARYPGLELLAAVAPDLDLLWFYTLGGRQTAHHAYLPHLPAAWLAVGLAWALAARGRPALRDAGLLVVPGALLHLLLDSVVGRIAWLWPLSPRQFALFEVPARYHPWVLNFLLHWTFAFELALLAWAAGVWATGRARAGD